jgi:hypothetical protein
VSRLLMLVDPYFWQAVGEEVLPSVREFLRKRPAVAFVGVLCALIILLRVLFAVLGLLFGGSSVVTTRVTGELKVDGVPVVDGTIQFLPKCDGHPASARIIDGLFDAQGVTVGPSRVICVAVKETGKTVTEGGHSFPELVSVIPENFRDGVDMTIEPRPKPLALDWRSQ